jgi:chemotaxis protein methyltransferase CheR
MGCTDTDFAYLRDVVMAESANLIHPSRNGLFEARLAPIAKLAGSSSLEDFVDLLRVDRTMHLHRAVAEAMTVNETSFFRDGRPFDLMRETILPRLIEKNSMEKKLRIWSAASSTGQEAYSLAMMICEHFPELKTWDVKVVGTDISQEVVEYAKRGRYRRLEVNRGLPARMLVKYLVRDGDEWEVTAKVRAMCEFRCAKLCAPLPKLPLFDLVLLRNVLLYFPQHDRGCVFDDVYRHTAPGGYLLLGAAEQAEDSTTLFQAEFARDSYFYRPVATS